LLHSFAGVAQDYLNSAFGLKRSLKGRNGAEKPRKKGAHLPQVAPARWQTSARPFMVSATPNSVWGAGFEIQDAQAPPLPQPLTIRHWMRYSVNSSVRYENLPACAHINADPCPTCVRKSLGFGEMP
jgi:hypothetical protein